MAAAAATCAISTHARPLHEPNRSLPPPMPMSKLGGGWADLPRDLLESVLARLPVPDRVRFPAVCTAWQCAHVEQATPLLSPWLMLPFNPTARAGGDDGGAEFSEARFLSLAEGRAYAIRQPAPAVHDRLCVGSSPDGWLVAADACSDLSLLNPVTGAQVRLPPAATLPFVDARRGADGSVASYALRCYFADGGGGGCGDEDPLVPPETLAPDRLRYEVYEKAIVVSPPRRVPDPSGSSSSFWSGHAVLLICQPLFRLAVARAGDAEWTLLDAPGRCWVDAVRASSGADGSPRRRQAVYTMDTAGRVGAWDTGAAATPREVAPPCGCSARACAMSAACRKYLVELSPGRLLQVHRLREAAHARYAWEPRPEHVEYTTTGVELFEWTAAAGQWARVDGKDAGGGRVLGGRALFLGKSASQCVPVDGVGRPGLRGNCVYFTDDGPWSHDRCHEVAPDVGVLDLADGSYMPPRGAARDLLWKWPPPVWVFPSLAS